MSYTVYRHTSPSGKVYIGITCRDVKKRWDNGRGYTYSHNKHFEGAIQKYGWENFAHEILLTGLTKEEAEAKEVELIKEYDSTNPARGYNIRSGGSAHSKLSEETKAKLSEMRRGEGNPMYGDHRPKPWQLGNNRGIVGENHPMYGRRGEDNPRYGMHHTPEAIAKMRTNSPARKPVRCIETGEVFESIQAACRWLGKEGRTGSAISLVCQHRPHYNTACGYHWEYAE